jgi:hypothetical protein
MFTLTRLFSAVLLGSLAWFLAPYYEALWVPQTELGHFEPWIFRCGLVVGWFFMGGLIGVRGMWFSVYATAQGLVVTAIAAAGIFAVREVFILGYRRRYTEPLDAVLGIPQIAGEYLAWTLNLDFLLLAAAGATLVGVFLHLLHAWMERRRLAR